MHTGPPVHTVGSIASVTASVPASSRALQCLSLCRRRSEANDRPQASQVGIFHRGQGACCRLLVDVEMYAKDCCHCDRRLVPVMSDYMTLSQSGGYARGSVTHALIRLQVQTRRHQHAQIHLSSELWILFLMLLVSISPNSCSGGA